MTRELSFIHECMEEKEPLKLWMKKGRARVDGDITSQDTF